MAGSTGTLHSCLALRATGASAPTGLTPTCCCTCAGSYATNPATGEAVPIWVADYVLGSYGSGAIMAVPGHDARDHECAVKFGLPIKQVVAGSGGEELPFCDPGTAVNSSSSGIDLNGLPTAEAKAKVRGPSAGLLGCWCSALAAGRQCSTG